MNLKTVCCCVVTLNISLWNNHLARRRWEQVLPYLSAVQYVGVQPLLTSCRKQCCNARYLLLSKSKKFTQILELSWSSNDITQKYYYRNISMYMRVFSHCQGTKLLFCWFFFVLRHILYLVNILYLQGSLWISPEDSIMFDLIYNLTLITLC